MDAVAEPEHLIGTVRGQAVDRDADVLPAQVIADFRLALRGGAPARGDVRDAGLQKIVERLLLAGQVAAHVAGLEQPVDLHAEQAAHVALEQRVAVHQHVDVVFLGDLRRFVGHRGRVGHGGRVVVGQLEFAAVGLGRQRRGVVDAQVGLGLFDELLRRFGDDLIDLIDLRCRNVLHRGRAGHQQTGDQQGGQPPGKQLLHVRTLL